MATAGAAQAIKNATANNSLKPRKPSVRSLYDAQKTCVVPKGCRNAPEVMIGYDAHSAGRFFRRPFSYIDNELRLPRMKGHFLVRALNHYATDWESPFCQHVYETEATSVRLNMVYLHMWLLSFHMSRPLKDISFVRDQIKRDHHNVMRTTIDDQNLLELQHRLIKKEHVKVYTNTFDDSIHEELKRQYRVINHSLSGLFAHSPRSLNGENRLLSRLDDDDLEELILYNILNEEPEAKREQVKRISDYIRISVHEEDKYTFSTRMESYYYMANVTNLFSQQDEEHKLERFRQVRAEENNN